MPNSGWKQKRSSCCYWSTSALLLHIPKFSSPKGVSERYRETANTRQPLGNSVPQVSILVDDLHLISAILWPSEPGGGRYRLFPVFPSLFVSNCACLRRIRCFYFVRRKLFLLGNLHVGNGVSQGKSYGLCSEMSYLVAFIHSSTGLLLGSAFMSQTDQALHSHIVALLKAWSAAHWDEQSPGRWWGHRPWRYSRAVGM